MLREEVDRWAENCITLTLYTFAAMANCYSITSDTVHCLRHRILNIDDRSEANSAVDSFILKPILLVPLYSNYSDMSQITESVHFDILMMSRNYFVSFQQLDSILASLNLPLLLPDV